jgi:hypothetical protein
VEHLRLARTQAVAPSSALAMWRVSAPGALHCPVSLARSAAARKNLPEVSRVPSVVEHLRLARSPAVAPSSALAMWQVSAPRALHCPVVLARSAAARKNLPEVSKALSAAERLHLARAQVVAPSERRRVPGPRALHCPVLLARSAAAPPVLMEQAAAERLRLARSQMAAQRRSLTLPETVRAVLPCPVSQV